MAARVKVENERVMAAKADMGALAIVAKDGAISSVVTTMREAVDVRVILGCTRIAAASRTDTLVEARTALTSEVVTRAADILTRE